LGGDILLFSFCERMQIGFINTVAQACFSFFYNKLLYRASGSAIKGAAWISIKRVSVTVKKQIKPNQLQARRNGKILVVYFTQVAFVFPPNFPLLHHRINWHSAEKLNLSRRFFFSKFGEKSYFDTNGKTVETRKLSHYSNFSRFMRYSLLAFFALSGTPSNCAFAFLTI
jgi:hypothetical protein